MTGKVVSVIGAGFAGMAAATYLADAGYQVSVFEKHDQAGGRARTFSAEGFTFDMGPSWYWMPDTFERYFADFSTQVSDFYKLDLLDPGFRIYFAKDDYLDIPPDQEELKSLLESMESGSAKRYDAFIADAEMKYRVGMQDLVEKPSLSITEFFDLRVLKGLFTMHLHTPFDKFVGRYFSHPRIRQLMEFPVLFLGATAAKTPALYSMMNYAGLKLGTWYPRGGMGMIAAGMKKLAEEKGVTFHFNAAIDEVEMINGMATAVISGEKRYSTDLVVSGADYHHTDRTLLTGASNYTEEYWTQRVMAPSCLLYYMGIGKKVKGLQHHNLFFDEDLGQHSTEIYDKPQWPSKPLFYVCCPSQSDETVAPEGCENIFLLMPLAAGLADDEKLRSRYRKVMLDRLQRLTGESIEEHIAYERSYCIADFKNDYNAYRGNAYGLANTLRQTAILKPSIKNKKLSNFYYTGQLTVPGPGVPPSLISGKLVAKQIIKEYPLNCS